MGRFFTEVAEPRFRGVCDRRRIPERRVAPTFYVAKHELTPSSNATFGFQPSFETILLMFAKVQSGSPGRLGT